MKGTPKKKLMREKWPDMLPEYDFSKGARGKYAKRYAEGSNMVVLSPDLAKVFRTSESVNEALRTLVRVGKKTVEKSFSVTNHIMEAIFKALPGSPALYISHLTAHDS